MAVEVMLEHLCSLTWPTNKCILLQNSDEALEVPNDAGLRVLEQ